MGDTGRFTGRAQRVLAWLAKQKKPKSARQCREAVDPSCTQSHMSGTLGTLASRGKVKRHKLAKGVGFTTTATAFVDERVAANQVPGGKGRRKRPSSGYANPVAVAAEAKRGDSRKRRAVAAVLEDRTAAIKAAAGRHVAPQPRRAPLNSCYTRTEVEARRPMREALADDVAAFQARGGVIERLAPGACSKPLASFQDWNEANWRTRQRRLAAQAESLNDDTDAGDLADVA